jgi:hypothetical protein
MAQLDPFEQQVMAVMAAHGLGVKRAGSLVPFRWFLSRTVFGLFVEV